MEVQPKVEASPAIQYTHANGEVAVVASVEAARRPGVCPVLARMSLEEIGLLLELKARGDEVIAEEKEEGKSEQKSVPQKVQRATSTEPKKAGQERAVGNADTEVDAKQTPAKPATVKPVTESIAISAAGEAAYGRPVRVSIRTLLADLVEVAALPGVEATGPLDTQPELKNATAPLEVYVDTQEAETAGVVRHDIGGLEIPVKRPAELIPASEPGRPVSEKLPAHVVTSDVRLLAPSEVVQGPNIISGAVEKMKGSGETHQQPATIPLVAQERVYVPPVVKPEVVAPNTVAVEIAVSDLDVGEVVVAERVAAEPVTADGVEGYIQLADEHYAAFPDEAEADVGLLDANTCVEDTSEEADEELPKAESVFPASPAVFKTEAINPAQSHGLAPPEALTWNEDTNPVLIELTDTSERTDQGRIDETPRISEMIMSPVSEIETFFDEVAAEPIEAGPRQLFIEQFDRGIAELSSEPAAPFAAPASVVGAVEELEIVSMGGLAQELPEDVGTREFLQKIQRGPTAAKQAVINICGLGRSVLHLYDAESTGRRLGII